MAGITGATGAVAGAYIADITDGEDRARHFGLMSACFGVGMVAGPVAGGLLGAISLHAPFLAAAVLNGLNLLLGCFLMQESHKGERRDPGHHRMAQNLSRYCMIGPEESQFRVVNVKPVTLYDVAEYAGVSYQTVSRVVNQASHVSAKTREKVEAAMAELNYIPNRVAQQLAGKQSLLIGVATSSLALHAPSQIVAAIKSRADQLGASVVVSMVERSGVEACKAAVHNLLAQRVSGLIINYPLDDQDAIAVEAACTNVPALFLDVSDQTPINSIIFSHEDGTRLGVEHLVALGHQQIALLAGPLSSVSARLRLAGWHKYLTRNQIQPIAEREGDWSAMSGFQQTMQMLNEGIVPTAMLVANDQMALGAMRAITESGLRVGADISVVGYDDTEDSSCYIPPLTTIKQDFRLLGQTSVDRLLQLSQGQAVKGNQLLPVSLVKRKTTLAPNTQTASPRALADSLMQLARQVSRLESGQ